MDTLVGRSYGSKCDSCNTSPCKCLNRNAAQSNSACPASPRLNSAGQRWIHFLVCGYHTSCTVQSEPCYQHVPTCARSDLSTDSSSAIAMRLNLFGYQVDMLFQSDPFFWPPASVLQDSGLDDRLEAVLQLSRILIGTSFSNYVVHFPHLCAVFPLSSGLVGIYLHVYTNEGLLYHRLNIRNLLPPRAGIERVLPLRNHVWELPLFWPQRHKAQRCCRRSRWDRLLVGLTFCNWTIVRIDKK